MTATESKTQSSIPENRGSGRMEEGARRASGQGKGGNACAAMRWLQSAGGCRWSGLIRNTSSPDPKGKMSLLDLFEGRRQLILYHFMFAPTVSGWPDAGCVGCSMVTDQFGHTAHLHARDTSFCLVSLAPLENIEKYKKRMGGLTPGTRPKAATSTGISVVPPTKAKSSASAFLSTTTLISIAPISPMDAARRG